METSLTRKPLALANWKMAMTISKSLAFVEQFQIAVGTLAELVDIVLCPPYTALYAVSHALTKTSIDVGAQNLCAAPGSAHTGEISAPLLVDAGCRWVVVGHWEIRRQRTETDRDLNKKLHAAFQADLRPILLVGEEANERGSVEEAFSERLPHLFADFGPGQAAQMALVYEPEWTIGVQEPAPDDYIGDGCSFIRGWIEQNFGEGAAQKARIIYGGSVSPGYAIGLLSSPDVDGLGAGRKGRDPVAFAEIVRLIAAAKGLTSNNRPKGK
jgi:triosephosphate isomerase